MKKIIVMITLMLLVLFSFLGLEAHEKNEMSAYNPVRNRLLPVYSVERDDKKIAISFDAAWGNEDTARILKILKDNDVKATFFMTGGWVEKYPEDVKAISKAGHDLGNHSENHKQMSKLSPGECKEEIQKVHDKVKDLTGKDMELFRPPYGDYNDTLISVAGELGYYPIQWSVDSLDWKGYEPDVLLKRICGSKDLKSGAIILMHNGGKHTADALDAIIKGLKNEGYEPVPISELIYRKDYRIDETGRQKV